MKMLWSGICSVINIKQSTLSGIPQLIVDSNKITEPKEIASALNKYFVNVPQQINKDIPRTKKSPMDYFSLIVNDSFCKGSYPGNLKIGKVVAPHKKGSTQLSTNIITFNLQ